LSAGLNEKIEDIERKSSINSGLTMVIFLSYSGKWDILQAITRYTSMVKNGEISQSEPLTAEKFSCLLSTADIPDPDLLIRTSGEQRISNYMLWQSAYTEFYFTDVLWPDFRKNDFRKALETYSDRERRYGKTRDQINNSI
jgi:undecaprenyl diphosphate synthase